MTGTLNKLAKIRASKTCNGEDSKVLDDLHLKSAASRRFLSGQISSEKTPKKKINQLL